MYNRTATISKGVEVRLTAILVPCGSNTRSFSSSPGAAGRCSSGNPCPCRNSGATVHSCSCGGWGGLWGATWGSCGGGSWSLPWASLTPRQQPAAPGLCLPQMEVWAGTAAGAQQGQQPLCAGHSGTASLWCVALLVLLLLSPFNK